MALNQIALLTYLLTYDFGEWVEVS